LKRAPSTTPREWLEELERPVSWQPWALPQGFDAAQSSAERPATVDRFLNAARTIVDRFYQARYQSRPLPTEVLAQVESSLAIIQECLTRT